MTPHVMEYLLDKKLTKAIRTKDYYQSLFDRSTNQSSKVCQQLERRIAYQGGIVEAIGYVLEMLKSLE